MPGILGFHFENAKGHPVGLLAFMLSSQAWVSFAPLFFKNAGPSSSKLYPSGQYRSSFDPLEILGLVIQMFKKRCK